MDQQIERPRLLAVLCILTFIGSGMTLFSDATVYVFFDNFQSIFASQPNLNFLGNTINMGSLLNINPLFFLFQALLAAMALTGARLMWNFRKIGFHIYAMAQILILIIPKFFITGLPFPAFELSLSALFTYLYFKHLSLMH